MGLAQYFLTHEENMRQSFSQPSRRARRTLPDGTTIDYIMNDVVDFISISPPQGIVRAMGKAMTWDKLPPLEEGTNYIDLSQMTEDPDVEGGYYCTVSVINGMDENGRMLPATFFIEASHTGWSIYQGVRQDDGTYKADGTNATLRLYEPLVDGMCTIIANDGRTILKTTASAFKDYFYYLGTDGLYYEINTLTGRLVTPAVGKAAESVSVSPFEFYGEQTEVRKDITYHTTYNKHTLITRSYSNFVLMDPEDPAYPYPTYRCLVTWKTVVTITILSSDDPLAEGSETITYAYGDWWASNNLPENWPTIIETDTNETVDGGRLGITTEGGGILPSFLVMQNPMSDGASVHTRAMKKPGEEVYFVVIENSATPDYKTIVWFINSTSYASYEFSYNLEGMLLDNIYYGGGV
jgi:hypothetical protein